METGVTREALELALAGKAKPVGSLGRVEDIAVQLGLLQDTLLPKVTDPVVAVFAGDHGAVGSGASAFPQAITAAMVGVYLEGRAAVNVFARQAGARVLVVDAGVSAQLADRPGLVATPVGQGTADLVLGPAMTEAQAALAVARGEAVMDQLADGGSTVVALGEMGIGNTLSAALLAHKVAGLPLVVGPGAGGHDAFSLERKRLAAGGAAARTAPRLDPMVALAEYGGFETAMLVGAMLRAEERRVCVVVDGVIVTAAALVAHAIRPSVLRACIFSHRSSEPGHDAMLEHLGVRPLLDLGMRLGEGSGAALALPMIQAAAHLVVEMANLTDVLPAPSVRVEAAGGPVMPEFTFPAFPTPPG